MRSFPSRNREGMSLVEGLIAVVAIGALAAGAGSGVMTARADADVRVAHDNAQQLAQIAEAYRLLGGRDTCPSAALLEQSHLLREGARAQDPWGTRYEVVCESRAIQVRSLGPDRRRGTSDDIVRF